MSRRSPRRSSATGASSRCTATGCSARSRTPRISSFDGRDAIITAMRKGLEPEFGAMRHVIAGANLQPTVAHYLRPPGEPGYRPLVIEVLRIDGALVAEITSFVFPELFPAFGLPSVL